MWVIICWSFHNRWDSTNWLCDMFTIWIYCNLPRLLDSLRKHAFFGVQITFSRAKSTSRWGAKVWGPVIPVMEQSILDLGIYKRYHFLLMEDLCSNEQTNDRILEGLQWHFILADVRTWCPKDQVHTMGTTGQQKFVLSDQKFFVFISEEMYKIAETTWKVTWQCRHNLTKVAHKSVRPSPYPRTVASLHIH